MFKVVKVLLLALLFNLPIRPGPHRSPRFVGVSRKAFQTPPSLGDIALLRTKGHFLVVSHNDAKWVKDFMVSDEIRGLSDEDFQRYLEESNSYLRVTQDSEGDYIIRTFGRMEGGSITASVIGTLVYGASSYYARRKKRHAQKRIDAKKQELLRRVRDEYGRIAGGVANTGWGFAEGAIDTAISDPVARGVEMLMEGANVTDADVQRVAISLQEGTIDLLSRNQSGRLVMRDNLYRSRARARYIADHPPATRTVRIDPNSTLERPPSIATNPDTSRFNPAEEASYLAVDDTSNSIELQSDLIPTPRAPEPDGSPPQMINIEVPDTGAMESYSDANNLDSHLDVNDLDATNPGVEFAGAGVAIGFDENAPADASLMESVTVDLLMELLF